METTDALATFGYGLTDPSGRLLIFTVSQFKATTIHRLVRLNTANTWAKLYRQGFRCHRVRVEALTATPTPDASGERDGEWSAIGPDMNDEGDK